MDRIEIRGLRLFGRHGCLRAETELGQRFALDIIAFCDCAPAGRSDELADAADYAALAAVAAEAFAPPRKLIEAAAAQVAQALLEAEPKLSGVEITVRKPSAPIEAIFDEVAVTIRRRRDG